MKPGMNLLKISISAQIDQVEKREKQFSLCDFRKDKLIYSRPTRNYA